MAHPASDRGRDRIGTVTGLSRSGSPGSLRRLRGWVHLDSRWVLYITRTNPNGIYECDSDFIPTAAEAEQIALEEIPQ